MSRHARVRRGDFAEPATLTEAFEGATPDAALRHRARLLRVTDADPDLISGDPGEQLLHRDAAQLAVAPVR